MSEFFRNILSAFEYQSPQDQSSGIPENSNQRLLSYAAYTLRRLYIDGVSRNSEVENLQRGIVPDTTQVQDETLSHTHQPDLIDLAEERILEALPNDSDMKVALIFQAVQDAIDYWEERLDDATITPEEARLAGSRLTYLTTKYEQIELAQEAADTGI